jgi:hypothetical protein
MGLLRGDRPFLKQKWGLMGRSLRKDPTRGVTDWIPDPVRRELHWISDRLVYPSDAADAFGRRTPGSPRFPARHAHRDDASEWGWTLQRKDGGNELACIR